MGDYSEPNKETPEEIEAQRRLVERLMRARESQKGHMAVYNAFTKRIRSAKAFIRRAEKRIEKNS